VDYWLSVELEYEIQFAIDLKKTILSLRVTGGDFLLPNPTNDEPAGNWYSMNQGISRRRERECPLPDTLTKSTTTSLK